MSKKVYALLKSYEDALVVPLLENWHRTTVSSWASRFEALYIGAYWIAFAFLTPLTARRLLQSAQAPSGRIGCTAVEYKIKRQTLGITPQGPWESRDVEQLRLWVRRFRSLGRWKIRSYEMDL